MPADRSNPAWGFMARNRMRITWWSLLLLLALTIALGERPVSLLPPQGLRATLALLLLLTGLGLRSWAAGVIRKDNQLADTGPYALSRHPLYLGNAMILFGLALQCGGLWLLLPVVLLAAWLYVPTLRNEEQVVTEHFGAGYEQYRQRVGWFGPKHWPVQWRQAWSAAQWWANREYELPPLILLLVLLLELWVYLAA